MNIQFEKCTPHGEVSVPPSKSITHRALIVGSFSKSVTEVENCLISDDTLATADCLKALGIDADFSHNGSAEIHGDMQKVKKMCTFHCRGSASTLRFMICVSLVKGIGGYFYGSKRLLERIKDEELNFLRENGITVLKSGNMLCCRGELKSGTYCVDAHLSSQWLSGLLMSLPFCDGDSVVTVKNKLNSKPYVDLTLAVLKDFGINTVNASYQRFYIKGNQSASYAGKYAVEGDYSAAACISALGLCGGDVVLKNLYPDSAQGDKRFYNYLNILKNGFLDIDIGDTPDLAPVLMVCGALLNGCSLNGISRLKNKESDRVAVMMREMSKFKFKADISGDRVTVFPSVPEKPVEPLCCENDHRIAMALSVILCKTGGILLGADCINKSYPAFFDDLAKLNVNFCEINGDLV